MKNMLLMAAVSTLMFACSSEKDSESIPNEGLVFELATVNQPQNTIDTRTRQLYSQDPIQEVERVQIYVFKKNGNDYVYNTNYSLPTWSKGSTFQRYTVPDNQKLPQGDYQFLAVGREATDNYTFTNPTVGTTKVSDMVTSITAPGMETEFFAGNKTITVSSEGARVNIEMTRKIAGVLGYFKNVPTVLNGQPVKYLRVTVSSTNDSIILYTGAGTGTASTTSYNIIDVDLSGQTVSGDVYAGNDLAAQGVVKVTNSQLFGKFIFPVTNISMTVGLYSDGNAELKKWTVTSDNNPVFNLEPNHFYALGQKISKNDTTGGGTPDPGDDDSPIDLLKDQVIAITINPNWNVIHNLFIQ